MGKTSVFSPRNIGQIRVLMQYSDIRQKEIAQKFNVSLQSVSSIKKSLPTKWKDWKMWLEKKNYCKIGPKDKKYGT